MNKYVSIEYTGPYSSLVKFVESKDLKFEIKPVSSGKALIKISDDLLDDVFFLSDAVIDEVKHEKINIIKEISENEFNNTSENGFEIIHNDDHSHNTHSTLLTTETKNTAQDENKQNQPSQSIDYTNTTNSNTSANTSTNNPTTNNTVTNNSKSNIEATNSNESNVNKNTIAFPAASVPINIVSEKVILPPKTDEEKLQRVAAALTDTILPSKSPLPESDPFNYLISKRFLTHFSAAATITLFVLTLFD